MTGRALVALDLDQTVIHSARPHDDLSGLRVVEHLDGRPAAVMSQVAWDLLEALAAGHDVVPMTTRTREQLLRVRLPSTVRHAVCANGGLLLRGGVVDAPWAAWARERADRSAPLADAEQVLARAVGDWVRLRRSAEGLFCYLVAEQAELIDACWLEQAAGWAAEHGWRVSRQGRKVYLVPEALSKEAAIGRLRDVLPTPEGRGPLLAAGDSLLDAGMLLAADAAVRPSHGELERHPGLVPGVTVVGGEGPTAGENVLRWLTERVATD